VSHVDPNAMGINPAWRKSSGYTPSGVGWSEGATTAEINALRAGFKEQMKIIQSIAPDSGAYLNEVSNILVFNATTVDLPHRRLPHMNLIGKNHYLARTTTNSRPSSTSMILTRFSLSGKVLDLMISTRHSIVV
jgi:hypothetical protein